MPWVLKVGALQKFREAADYTVLMLARRTGISDRQIRKMECHPPPGSIFVSNLYALTSVLGCTKEDLATWIPKRPRQAAVEEPPEKPKRRRQSADFKPPRNLQELADLERQLRLNGELETRISTDAGEFELLGAERMLECHTQFGAFEGQRFAVVGRVEQHAALPHSAAKILKTESGVGARFLLGRDIVYSVPVEATVITTSAENTRKMIELARDENPATVIVRVHVARPRNHWKGFVEINGETAPLPFAFVVEDVIE